MFYQFQQVLIENQYRELYFQPLLSKIFNWIVNKIQLLTGHNLIYFYLEISAHQLSLISFDWNELQLWFLCQKAPSFV